MGLSPPTRGILEFGRLPEIALRSIPAYAGDPHDFAFGEFKGTVYPRLRGGSARACINRWRATGLSPPTRGIPAKALSASRRLRSIPAYAGDPLLNARIVAVNAVYPRLRGGSPSTIRRIDCVCGLSPPTRGIHILPTLPPADLRSIPAYAGDPRSSAACARQAGVYPRLRGGSRRVAAEQVGDEGLSPPTRGILVLRLDLRVKARSIPAYAGDPIIVSHDAPTLAVYPRLRGGSSSCVSTCA